MLDKRVIAGLAAVMVVLVCGPVALAAVGVGLLAGVSGNVGGVLGAAGDPETVNNDFMICDPGGELSAMVMGVKFEVTPEMFGHAVTIVQVGKSRQVPSRGWVIAVATALQESKLTNLPHLGEDNDHDSVGLFQQRPKTGWGTVEQIMDPKYAATAFYGGPDVPPDNRGLLDIPGWQRLSLTEAAQAVQISGLPDAYAKWEQLANAIVGRASEVKCGSIDLKGKAKVVVDAAMRWRGTPYCWAAGDASGPTKTAWCPSGPPGFDCSGLTLYAYAQVGINLGHWTGSQWHAGTQIRDRNALAPGDLVFFSSDGSESGIHHVGLYLGNGSMVHAPQTGDVVRVVDNMWSNSYWVAQFIGGVRLLPAEA